MEPQLSLKFYPSIPDRPGTLSSRLYALLLDEKRPMTMDRMDMNVRKINTVPALLTNVAPKRLIIQRISSIRKLKKRMLKAIGPRLKPTAT